MMPLRRACLAVLACAFAIAGLVGCGSGPGPVVQCDCARAFSPAYALDVTTAGRVRWQVRLAGGMSESGASQPSPLAVGPVAVFAPGGVLYGLRLADGHRVWSRAVGQDKDVASMWQWQDLVIVLTANAGGWPLLTGLDASTGRTRWTQSVGEYVEGAYLTADGGLAVFSGADTLEVVDLSSGRLRWTRPAGYPSGLGLSYGYPPPMAVAGGAVLFAVIDQLTSYDDRTGQVRWTDGLRTLEPGGSTGEPGLLASAGQVYLPQGLQVLGISAADGRVKWRFAPSPPEAVDAYAPGLVSVTSSSGGTWQDELDPATGRVRWQVASAYQAIATPAGIITGTGPESTDQVSLRDTLTGQARWTATLAGPNLGWQHAPALPVFPAGPLLIVPAAAPEGSQGPGQLVAFRMADGHRAWQVTIPGPAAAPPSAVPGGMLVYSVRNLTAPASAGARKTSCAGTRGWAVMDRP
jgi:outer membrane protein assembly factor BamB